MLSAEFKVNGTLIGVLVIIRKHTGATTNKYRYKFVELDTEDAPKYGEVFHTYSDGAAALVRRCLENLE